jgi:signal peptidase II
MVGVELTLQRHGRLVFTLVVFSVLVFCQLCSFWVYSEMPIGSSHKVTSFLHFTHVRNLGGIFGIFQGKGWIFATVSLLFIGALVFFIMRSRSVRLFEYVFYGLIVGGGLSNITDRLIYGSVIDFIDIRGISFWHYVFNTADVMIHVGVWPLVWVYMFPRKQDVVSQSEAA